MQTVWQKVQHHFSGNPQDLVEIIFEGITAEKWHDFFNWVVTQPARVMTQLGYIDLADLSYERFMAGEEGYIVSVATPGGIVIHLEFIVLGQLDINIAIEDIPNERAFYDLLSFTNFLASLTHCSRYFIFPEFKPDDAFIINGQLVA